jgi:hypothetical protein
MSKKRAQPHSHFGGIKNVCFDCHDVCFKPHDRTEVGSWTKLSVALLNRCYDISDFIEISGFYQTVA